MNKATLLMTLQYMMILVMDGRKFQQFLSTVPTLQ